jgi:hypothetical protein
LHALRQSRSLRPYFAPRALHRVLNADVLARVATKPFAAQTTAGPQEFSRGAIVVPLDRQEHGRAEIHELMRTIAIEDGITVHALTSGRSTTGSAGINVGGPSVRPLTLPKVLLVVGDDVNLYDAGEIWHLADYRMRMPITLRSRGSLGDIDWDRYTLGGRWATSTGTAIRILSFPVVSMKSMRRTLPIA